MTVLAGTGAVLGCDPGNNTGMAWGLDRRLIACYLAAPGDALVVPGALTVRGGRAVFEYPKFYGCKAYGKASVAYGVGNSLIREAVTLGGFKYQASALGMACEEVLPRTWKGTLPKRAMLRVIVDALDADERKIVKALGLPASLVHNVLDAIGLVLWSWDRLELRRTA